MLTNKEYAAAHNVPEILPKEVEDFALFSLDMDKAVNVVRERSQDGRVVKRTIKPAISGLHGRSVSFPLWKVKPAPTVSLATFRKMQIKEMEQERQANLAKYISQGYMEDMRAATNPHDGVGQE